METKAYGKKTVLLCALYLTAVAAASFFAMNAFTRPVFGNVAQWQLSFYVLAACLAVCAAIKKPSVSLCVCAATAIATQFFTQLYVGLFFPVTLQAAAFDAAKDRSKRGGAVFWLSVALFTPTVFFRVTAGKWLADNAINLQSSEPAGEKFLCSAGLILLTALWVWLLIRSLHTKPKKKAPASAKKSERNARTAKKTAEKDISYRLSVVYILCILNTVAAGIQCAFLFTAEFTKTVFFSAALFLGFLFFRQAIPLYDPDRCKAIFFPPCDTVKTETGESE